MKLDVTFSEKEVITHVCERLENALSISPRQVSTESFIVTIDSSNIQIPGERLKVRNRGYCLCDCYILKIMNRLCKMILFEALPSIL